MGKVIVLLLLLTACEEYPKYYRTYQKVMPDSLEQEKQKFIIDLVSAASFHMTGGDYEDPEDVIQQAAYTFDEIHSKRVEGLMRIDHHGAYGDFIPYNKLDSAELVIWTTAQ